MIIYILVYQSDWINKVYLNSTHGRENIYIFVSKCGNTKTLVVTQRAKPMRGVFSSQRTKDMRVCVFVVVFWREREKEREKREREKQSVTFLGFHIF